MEKRCFWSPYIGSVTLDFESHENPMKTFLGILRVFMAFPQFFHGSVLSLFSLSFAPWITHEKLLKHKILGVHEKGEDHKKAMKKPLFSSEVELHFSNIFMAMKISLIYYLTFRVQMYGLFMASVIFRAMKIAWFSYES